MLHTWSLSVIDKVLGGKMKISSLRASNLAVGVVVPPDSRTILTEVNLCSLKPTTDYLISF